MLLALGWKLAAGLSRFVPVDGAEPQRLRVMFVAREPGAIPALPLPPPATLPAAVAGVRSSPPMPPVHAVAKPLPPNAPVVVTVQAGPDLFDAAGRPRLPAERSDRWNPPPAAVPGSASALPAGSGADRQVMERRNPIEVRSTRFAQAWKSDGDAADVAAQDIARAQRKIAEFLFGKDVEHARARPSPEVRFNPARHERSADLGSEATGNAYKAAPINYEPAPGLDGEASRRIREQVAALETGYARCDRARLRELMQPLLQHLDELQRAEAAHARGADPIRAEHMLPNVANGAYDMARRALWYANSRMAGCGG